MSQNEHQHNKATSTLNKHSQTPIKHAHTHTHTQAVVVFSGGIPALPNLYYLQSSIIMPDWQSLTSITVVITMFNVVPALNALVQYVAYGVSYYCYVSS